jgi:amino acid transporter
MILPSFRYRAAWSRRALRFFWVFFACFGALVGILAFIYCFIISVLFMSMGGFWSVLLMWLIGLVLGVAAYFLTGLLPAALCEVCLAILDLRDGQDAFLDRIKVKSPAAAVGKPNAQP